MLSSTTDTPAKKTGLWWKGLLAGLFIVSALLSFGYLWFENNSSALREAPEAEAVLSAQSKMPFQVLIPAYLPASFNRQKVEIHTDQTGPEGQAMVSLIYTSQRGVKLAVTEWIPRDPESTPPAGKTIQNVGEAVRPCNCLCQDHQVCSITRLMVEVGALRIMSETSNPRLLSRQHMQAILQTLGPASGLQVYSSLEEIPQINALPPAVQAPVNANGIQEVVLVVSPNGYDPAHFAVKKDIPVRLIFRQLGNVGCGNELLIRWDPEQEGHLILSSPADKQVLEFTPHQSGDFPFSCPHKIYEGVMTVQE